MATTSSSSTTTAGNEPAVNEWQVLIQSFSAASLQKIHAIDPRLPLVFLGNPSIAQLPAVAGYAIGVGPSYTGAGINAEWVAAAHAQCLNVHPYTVNDPAAMQRLLDYGVDGMFTNYVDRLNALLGDRNAPGRQGALDAKAADEACHARIKETTVGGTVGSALEITLGGPVDFGSFTPGAGLDYAATTTATVVSIASTATLTVSDPSATAPGRLVNGGYALAQPLQVRAQSRIATGGGFAPLPSAALTYATPASNDVVTLGFKQPIAATDGLRTGRYGKTLTFTLSTTAP